MVNREMRFFLSSTFKDLQEERTALVKLFDRLRPTVARRGIYLSLVDLRWGITEEEEKSGQVLDLCLQEIDKSSPFFIGIIGDRYGYVPRSEDIAPDMLKKYPWIKEEFEQGHSVTEIEIQYGALRRNSGVEAMFFLKEPPASYRLRSLFPSQTEKFKNRIRKQDRYPVDTFRTTEELCQKVERMMELLIEKYSPKETISRVEMMRRQQLTHIMLHHSIYIKDDDAFKRLDSFMQEGKSLLAIIGEHGIGKSALLANWISSFSQGNPYYCIYHFLDNSLCENTPDSILTHICEEIKSLYNLNDNDTSVSYNDEDMKRFLKMAHERDDKPLVIVLDGLNNLLEDDKLLLWLPQLPGFVKYVFSTTTNDASFDTVTRWEASVYQMSCLDLERRQKFVSAYLSKQGKKLSDYQLHLLLNSYVTRNMRILEVILDELIRFGQFERLNEQIQSYQNDSSDEEFYINLIYRLKKNYKKELIEQSLALISLSRRGLSHDEIIRMTNSRKIDWLSFYHAFASLFVENDGRITFSDNTLKNCIIDVFLNDTNKRKQYRERIIDVFLQQFSLIFDTSSIDSLKWESCYVSTAELAFQFHALGDAKRLYKIISYFGVFIQLYHEDESSLAIYWRWLLTQGKDYQLSVYLDQTKEPIDCLWLSTFIDRYFGYTGLDKLYTERANQLKPPPNDAEDYSASVQNHNAWTMYKQRDVSGAIENYESQVASLDPDESTEDYYLACNNLAVIYSDIELFNKSLLFFEKAIHVAEKNHWYVRSALGEAGIATVYHKMQLFAVAQDHLQGAIDTIYRLFGEKHLWMANLLNQMGELKDAMDEEKDALSFLERALAIRMELLGENHPDVAHSYSNIGLVYYKLKNGSQALSFSKKAVDIITSVDSSDKASLALFYNRLALAYELNLDREKEEGAYEKALQFQLEARGEYQTLTAIIYYNWAYLLYRQRKYQDAAEKAAQCLEIRKRILPPSHPELLESHILRGVIAHKMKDDRTAEIHYSQAEMILRQKDSRYSYSKAMEIDTYHSLYGIHADRKDGKELAYVELLVPLMDEDFVQSNTEQCISFFIDAGNGYSYYGQHQKALELYEFAYKELRKKEGENNPKAAETLINMGNCLMKIERYSDSKVAYEKADKIYYTLYGGNYPNRQSVLKYIKVLRFAEQNPAIVRMWQRQYPGTLPLVVD